MLHLSNAARLFYPNELPPDHQSSAFWKEAPQGVIAYEGLRREWHGKSPYATGDALAMGWGPATDLALYGSSYVGFLGGIVRTTNVQGILSLDCLATDFFRAPAHPTALLYNPIQMRERYGSLGVGATRSIDCKCRFSLLQRGASRHGTRPIPPTGRILVQVPAGAPVSRAGHKLIAGDYTISPSLAVTRRRIPPPARALRPGFPPEGGPILSAGHAAEKPG